MWRSAPDFVIGAVRQRALRIALLLAAAASQADSSFPILLDGPLSSEARVRLTTPFGPLLAPLRPVAPISRAVVVVDEDGLEAEDRQRIRAAIEGLLRGAFSEPPKLYAYAGGSVRELDELKSAAAVRRAVDRLFPAGGAEAAEVAERTPLVLEKFAGWFGSSPEGWRRLVWIGRGIEAEDPAREFALARFVFELGRARLRLDHWTLGHESTELFRGAAEATGGRVESGLETAAEAGPAEPPVAWEAEIPAVALTAGFHVDRVHFPAELGGRAVPRLSLPPYGRAPSLVEFVQAVWARRRAEEFDRDGAPFEEVRAALETAIRFHPRDREALEFGAAAMERRERFDEAARMADALLEVSNDEASALVRAGLLWSRAGASAVAESRLARAWAMGVRTFDVALVRGRIRSGDGDFEGAAPILAEAANLDPDNAEVWLMLAEAHARTDRPEPRAAALEQAVRLGAASIEQRLLLAGLYLDADRAADAGRHLRAMLAEAPPGLEARERLAELFERAGGAGEALAAWRLALEADPVSERAHDAIRRLHEDAGRLGEALAAARAAIEALPDSEGARLAEARLLIAADRIEEARRALRSTPPAAAGPALLALAAEWEDAFGGAAAPLYRALAEAAARREPAGSEEWRAAAERGLEVALRDDDEESQAWFSGELQRAGIEAAGSAAKPAPEDSDAAIVPGGARALLFVALADATSGARDAAADYARTLLGHVDPASGKVRDDYARRIDEYFAMLEKLRPLGTAAARRTAFELSLATPEARARTQKVLALLGWEVRRAKSAYTVEPSLKEDRSNRQAIATGLGLDEVEMSERLSSGGAYSFEIDDEPAPLFLGESAWKSAFYANRRLPGGFFEMAVRDPRVARLYVALDSMDAESAAILVETFGLKRLAERNDDALFRYAAALEIRRDKVAVPGGEQAEAVWANLAGANPSDPRRFLRAVLEKDGGRFLQFYALVAELDAPRQRFFTRSLERAGAFYRVFRDSPEARGSAVRLDGSSIEDLLRRAPLDAEGRLLFPGGPAVWLSTRGQVDSTDRIVRRAGRLSRVATPDVEDEVLLRVGRADFKTGNVRRGQVENFLAVTAVDSARDEPLDEASALLLADSRAGNEGLYGYFTQLAALGFDEYRAILDTARPLAGVSKGEANRRLALLHSGLAILSIAERRGRVTSAESARLAGKLAGGLRAAGSLAAAAANSLDVVVELLAAANPQRQEGGADRELRELLIGGARPDGDTASGSLGQAWGDRRRREYGEVLALQRAPGLDLLLRLEDLLQAIELSGASLPEAVRDLLAATAELPAAEVPKELDADGLRKTNLAQFDPREAVEAARRMEREAAKKKPGAESLRRLAAEYREAVAPQTGLALSAALYAAFLRPDDLPVADDPLFLRKHEYTELVPERKPLFPHGRLLNPGDSLGGRALGGFGDFAAVAGTAAVAGIANVSPHARRALEASLADLRATDWSAISDRDVRFVRLSTVAAADWLMRSGADPKLLDLVAEASAGLLSTARRASLLRAIEDGSWSETRRAATLGDLHFLAVRLLDAGAAELARTPAIDRFAALAPAVRDGRGIHHLGSAAPLLRHDPRPRLAELPPYEDLTTLFPAHVAERAAESKFDLARVASAAALPAAALPSLAEPLARLAATRRAMVDHRDWRSVLDGLASLTEADGEAILGGTP